ncbi:MAG: protein kinase [Ignavibacteria bacterium]|nr:protein kinase [Ignavibacteria bacterium]
MIGQTISHYKILEKLGEGGMGVVYKAEDTKLDRLVALKFLPSHLAASEQDKARFIQEARAAAALNHPNVCSVIDIQEVADRQFIIMEFVEGENLKTKIRKEKLTLDQITDIGLQIAQGLNAAHNKHIVHRDIKSDNIMITKDGQVKIMDFGLAKLKGDHGLTKTGTTIGTVAYMAPEQIQGMEVDHRTDLWAFGVVLYEMMSGTLPFRGEHEAALMYEVLNIEPKPIPSVRSDIPDRVQSLIMQLLQKDYWKLTSSAAEIIKQLKQPVAAAHHVNTEKSVAVLYFDNMSSEKESEYLCAGIAEDIITDLSKIKELKVVSRSDVQPYRNKEVNMRQVGETLRVKYILEGSVRKAGNKIRITAQLIEVKTGFHVWAERYDRLIEDIFDLQDEIAQSIVKALKLSLTDSEKQSLAKKPTDDLRAYDFYMRGRESLFKRGKKNTVAAIQMLENAIALDPNFTSAYAALAEASYNMFTFYDGTPEWLRKTIESSQKALTLDPNSIEAQFGIGTVYFHQKRYAEAQRTLEKVIQQNPDHYDAYRWLGIISDILKDYDAALQWYEHCVKLKPYSEEPWMHIEMTYRRKGDEKGSEQARRKIIEVAERKLEVNPDDVIVLSRVAGPYAQFGEKEKTYRALKRVLELDPDDGLALYNCACCYAVMGDKKEAYACLRNASQNGYKYGSEWVRSDPDFSPYHEDPEFKALLAEIG